ncbi:hypothetical protein GW17_00037641, partial [Ensete ventricosum]
KKKKRKRRKKKRGRRKKYLALMRVTREPSPPSPAGDFSPARGERSRRQKDNRRQGLQFRRVLLGTGGTYRSPADSVRGLLAIRRYHCLGLFPPRYHPKSIDNDRFRSSLVTIGR